MDETQTSRVVYTNVSTHTFITTARPEGRNYLPCVSFPNPEGTGDETGGSHGRFWDHTSVERYLLLVYLLSYLTMNFPFVNRDQFFLDVNLFSFIPCVCVRVCVSPDSLYSFWVRCLRKDLSIFRSLCKSHTGVCSRNRVTD